MSEQTPGSSVLLLTRLAAFSRFIDRRAAWVVLATLIVASLLRSGVVLWNWFELSPGLLTGWDRPDNAFRSNVLFNAFGSLWQGIIGDPDDLTWLLAQCFLALMAVIVVTWLVYRATSTPSRYLATAAVLSSGIAAVLWREIGRYDFIFLVAITIGFLAARQWIVWVALGVAALSAPEQAMLAGVSVVLLTLSPTFSRWRRRASALLSLSVLAALAVQVWFTVLGNPYATRLGLSFAFLSGETIAAPSRFDATQGAFAAIFQKFYEGLANGLPLLWSYLGAGVLAWIIVLLLQPHLRHVLIVAFAVLALPLFTTLFFGEDPTRDLVIVGAPMIILVIVVAAGTVARCAATLPGGAGVWLDWSAVLVTILPMLYMFMYPEAPYDFIVHMLISWNNGTPIDWSGTSR